MVILAAIVLDVAVVSAVWWATVTWSRHRQAVRRYHHDLSDAVSEVLRAGAPDPEVFDAMASGDYDDWIAGSAEVSAGRAQTIGSALDSARDLVPATSGARQAAETTAHTIDSPAVSQAPSLPPPSPRVSEVLRARLTALRDTPGWSVAQEINGPDPDGEGA